MIEKLQKIFPSLVVKTDLLKDSQEKYEWFSVQEKIVGILRKDLTEKDQALLHTFLSPHEEELPQLTEQEKIWQERIFHNLHEDSEINYRFVYFTLPEKQTDPYSFKASINELFHKDVPILWENKNEGIIIEEKAQIKDEDISYEQIIDVLISDLYVNVKFFVGPFIQNTINAKTDYHFVIRSGRIVFRFSEKNVLTYLEAIPFHLIDKMESDQRKDFSRYVLQAFREDKELLRTIQVFLDSNLNISVAAKKLYMHRNSLQYRLDKFFDHTGIDVRDFHQALTVYLAILATLSD